MKKHIKEVRDDGTQIVFHDLEPMDIVTLRTDYPLESDPDRLLKRFGRRDITALGILMLGGAGLYLLRSKLPNTEAGSHRVAPDGRLHRVPSFVDQRLMVVDRQYHASRYDAPGHIMYVDGRLLLGRDLMPDPMATLVGNAVSRVHTAIYDIGEHDMVTIENLNPPNGTTVCSAEPVVIPRLPRS